MRTSHDVGMLSSIFHTFPLHFTFRIQVHHERNHNEVRGQFEEMFGIPLGSKIYTLSCPNNGNPCLAAVEFLDKNENELLEKKKLKKKNSRKKATAATGGGRIIWSNEEIQKLVGATWTYGKSWTTIKQKDHFWSEDNKTPKQMKINFSFKDQI